MSEQIKVELQEHMGNDRSIANSAWTSSTTFSGKLNKTDEQVEELINRLIKDKHSTPLESVVFRFWIKMPIQTDRQHMTHRIASHSGMSGRYRTMPNEWMKIPDDMKELIVKAYGENMFNEYENLCKKNNEWYQECLKIAKENEKNNVITNSEYKRFREFFRGVLPQNNMTERVTIMNLRSFANYQKLRNSEHAQPEIKQVANMMLNEVRIKNICPIAIKSLEENKWEI
jgi:thymidylate synthase (FAD)